MIKTFIFDLGGVLFTNGTKRFVATTSEKYHLDPALVLDVMDGEIGSAYRESQILKEEFWKRALQKLEIQADPGELNTLWIDGYELIEGTRDIILELNKKYKVYYLSDNVKERVERIEERYSFLSWFDGGIFSYDVDIRKPDPKMYSLVLDQSNSQAEEAVFVDDKESALVPARQMGITTILFENPEQLRQDIERLGLL